jgi:glycosyltransferase involved in cell wall biosynthesis
VNCTISIVVPAFNEAAILARTLAVIRESAGAFDEAGVTWELIVCDNNSTDRTAAIAGEAGAHVVFEPINQIGRARNTGAAAAKGEWLLFIDADSHPSRELLADVAREISGPVGRDPRRGPGGRCLAGGSAVTIDQPSRAARIVIASWNLTSRLTRWAAGSFIFCEASAFREVGGFNLQLFAAEEIDLFRRLKRLARSRRRSIRILSDHPLLTSGRKEHLYSPREFLTFQLKTVLTGGRTLRSVDDCAMWYDGRR